MYSCKNCKSDSYVEENDMTGASLYADPKLAAYRRGEGRLPKKHWLWPLYGAGLENLGRDGRPIQVDMPACGPDELLVRHDAVGLCFSDTKIIQAGPTHPRLSGRDMQANPVVMGHEVILTVIEVGERRRGQFARGQRYIVQADIIYQGVGLAYGYALQGGLSQYNVVGKEVLDGDEGCYLLPVKDETGYAQAALTEPWACVTASYEVVYRAGWKPGGAVLIAAGPGAPADATVSTPYAGGQAPARVVLMGVRGALREALVRRAEADGCALVVLDGSGEGDAEAARAAAGQGGYDDIVLLGPDAALYERLEPLAARGGVINIVGAGAFDRAAQVDVGRLHYDGLSLTGTDQADIAAAYEPVRTELLAGGNAVFVGAAGPMGQMHVQRALQAAHGPRRLVASDLVPERLAVLEAKFAQLIEAKRGVSDLILRTPGDLSPAQFNASLVAEMGGQGFDDVVVLAPSARVVAGAVEMLAPGGVMNIFAGLPRGTKAPIDLSVVVTKGVRFTGTSGSAISDLRSMLNQAESGRLDPNLSVAAISGLCDVKKGLEGMMHQAYAGKVVIYPQILDFPLTELPDLKTVLPTVYAKLGPNESWTVEAEAEFLKEMLP